MKWLGNGLMIAAVVGLGWIIFPFIKEEYNYRYGQPPARQSSTGYTIEIPAIKIKAPVIAGVDPFKKQEYLAALQQGVAQAKDSALPGKPGTQYLFAHSSDTPFRITQYNTAFYRLNKLKPGEEIRVDYEGKSYHYRVREIKTVRPGETKYLTNSQKDQLILQTCTPIGTDWNRLLVFAEPV